MIATRIRPLLWAALVISVLCGMAGTHAARGQELEADDSVQWRREADFVKQLEARVDLTWDQVPLREGLQRLARAQRVAIFLDRRVDPGKRVDIAVRGEALNVLLARIAIQVEMSVGRVADVVYLGPSQTAERLETVAELQSQYARSLGSEQSLKLLEQVTYSWDEAAQPRKILRQIADQCELEWNNLDQVIPHDLWPAAELPRLRRTELLTLVLAGFHATYRLQNDGSRTNLALIPIPEKVQLTKSHSFAGDHAEAIAKIKQLFPEVDVHSQGKTLVVAGPQSSQDGVARLLRGEPVRRTMVQPGEKRYTLNVQQQPLVSVVKALAPQLGLSVVVPDDPPPALGQRISFTVEKANLDELLDSIFESTEFTYRREGEKLIVVPRPD